MQRLHTFFKYVLPCFLLLIVITGLIEPIDAGLRKTQSSVPDTPALHDTVTIEPRETWLAQAAKPFKKHIPIQITVHHEGGKVLAPTDDASVRLKNIQTWCMGPDRNWADIPYHLLIAADGTVYQGRNPLTVGESNTAYDPTGHLLICFLGNYSEQQLDENLIQVLIDLLVDSCIKYNIDPSEISTHRDHSDQTECPGEDIYSYFQSGYIVEQVSQTLEARGVSPRGNN